YDRAIHDLAEGLHSWRVWGRLGWLEVKRQYRRTMLGPLWVTLSLGILSAAMGVVWSKLFGQDIAVYLPFVTTGIVSWSFVSGLINGGCTVYTGGENVIKQLRVPMSLLNFILVWRNVILLLHNLVIVVFVVAIFPVRVTWATALVIPGIIIVAANG